MPARKSTDRPSRGAHTGSNPSRGSFAAITPSTIPITGRGRGSGRPRGRPRGSRKARPTFSERQPAERTSSGNNKRGSRGASSRVRIFANREQSVASSSKASKRSAVKRRPSWEISDEEDDRERRGWNLADLSGSEFEEEEDNESNRFDDSSWDEEETSAIFEDVASTSMDAKDEDEEQQEIFCPWVELPADQIPALELPSSSRDLLIISAHLMQTLEIYEVLLNFSHLLQLSPFIFEDFCCALRNQSQSKLLAEIHVAFLRLFFREEEQEHTIFAATETNLSFSIILRLLDHMNFAEVLRHYVESDSSFSRQVLDILSTTNYPFVSLEKRLVVLRWMCDRFFETEIFKRMVKSQGLVKHDQHCRDCAKAQGEMLACYGCEAVYHPTCAGYADGVELSEQEQQFWLCTICQKHQVRGATDSILPGQSALRKLPLGYDRNGRIYWFLARRIFILDPASDTIYYYSTLPQLYDLFCALDPKFYERRLCLVLADLLPDVAVQMFNTLEITEERRLLLQERTGKEVAEAYLQVDNAHLMAKILSESSTKQNGGMEKLPKKEELEEEKEENDDEEEKQQMEQPKAEDEETLLRRLRKDIVQMARHFLCIRNGHLEANFWSGGQEEQQLLADYREWNAAAASDPETFENLSADLEQRICRGSRLGFSDAGHRNYVNFYTTDELAKSPQARAKDRDKRRYLNQRFSIADEGEFTWPSQKNASPFGPEQEVLRCIVLSFRRLIDRIPEGLMHRLWVLENRKQTFMQRLQQCMDMDTLRELMLLFERAIRKPAFLNIWWGSLSLTRLIRMTSEDRERRQKMEGQKKKEEKLLASAELADGYSDIVWVKYTLYNGQLPKHNIWKNRDNEQYRINGLGALGGWLWVSCTLTRRFLPLAARPNAEEPNSLASMKASRLRKIANKLLMWRTAEEFASSETETGVKSEQLGCDSEKCQQLVAQVCASVSNITVDDDRQEAERESLLMPCDNPDCMRNRPKAADQTSGSAKARPNKLGSNGGSPPMTEQEEGGELGVDKPFPFPTPYNFRRKSGKESILVLPEWCLKRMARQGGLSANTLAPGFHYTANKNATVWPYPCPRPLFDHCWRYLTTTKSSSLHALALRFRQMYASIRWMDLWPEDPDDPDTRVWTHHADYDEVRTVIGHKENPPDGYYETYKIRVEQYSLWEDILPNGGAGDGEWDGDFRQRHPKLRESRGGRRAARKRARLADGLNRQQMARRRPTKTEERWIDGVELKLYEIADYWEAFFAEQDIARRRQEFDDSRGSSLLVEHGYGQQQQQVKMEQYKYTPMGTGQISNRQQQQHHQQKQQYMITAPIGQHQQTSAVYVPQHQQQKYQPTTAYAPGRQTAAGNHQYVQRQPQQSQYQQPTHYIQQYQQQQRGGTPEMTLREVIQQAALQKQQPQQFLYQQQTGAMPSTTTTFVTYQQHQQPYQTVQTHVQPPQQQQFVYFVRQTDSPQSQHQHQPYQQNGFGGGNNGGGAAGRSGGNGQSQVYWRP